MPKKQNTFINEILEEGYKWGKFLSSFVPPHRMTMRQAANPEYYRIKAVEYMERRGLVATVSKQGKKFLKMTKKGQLELLLSKAKLEKQSKWDGRWRMVIFDIPEDAKKQRDRLRHLLKLNNFYQLQASVYINPYPLNREAIRFLEMSRLMDYIRIIRIDEMDNDLDLKKKFCLN